MKKTTEYQVCAIDKAAKTAKALEIISADSISSAIKLSSEKYPGICTKTYPMTSADDGESVIAMAKLAVRSYERWERGNSHACNNPDKRSPQDKEDMISDAVTAIIDILRENPSANMYEVKSKAFSTIGAKRKQLQRVKEVEFMPGYGACNPSPKERKPISTNPKLDKMLRKALDMANLSEAQKETLTMFCDGIRPTDIADITGKSRKNVTKTLARAYYWVLAKVYELEEGIETLYTAQGIDNIDVLENLEVMRRRGEMGRNPAKIEFFDWLNEQLESYC